MLRRAHLLIYNLVHFTESLRGTILFRWRRVKRLSRCATHESERVFLDALRKTVFPETRWIALDRLEGTLTIQEAEKRIACLPLKNDPPRFISPPRGFPSRHIVSATRATATVLRVQRQARAERGDVYTSEHASRILGVDCGTIVRWVEAGFCGAARK